MNKLLATYVEQWFMAQTKDRDKVWSNDEGQNGTKEFPPPRKMSSKFHPPTVKMKTLKKL